MDRRLMNTSWLQGRLHALHALHKETVTEYGDLVRSLTSECDILCDVIPGYKVTPNMMGQQQQKDEEGGGKGSKKTQQRKQKEVHVVETLEAEVLKQYEHFLQLLRKLQGKQHPEQQALGCRLMCKILPIAHAFNHGDRLLACAVDYANSKSTRVAQPALNALQDLLNGEMVSDSTNHVVSHILDIVRRERHALNPKLLTLLLSIRVAMLDVHAADITAEKAKEKRMKKEDKELARQMRKASARRDRSELAAKQTQVISKVFVIYLRVLQASRTCPKEHQARILAPALEGLVKFAPLVNLELFHQLNTALKELLGIRAVSFVKQEQQQERAGRNQRHDPRALEDLARRLAAQVAVKDPKQRTITLPGGTTQDEAAAVEGEEGDEEEETCTVTTALHALVAAACLSQRDMSAEASEWKEDMVEFHNKLFQLLPKALSPPPVPPPPKEEDDEAAATDAAETQSRASSSASVSSSGSLASSTFSIAASMAQHQQFVHGSVVREWAFRCNLVVRAVDILVLCQRHLPIPRVQALARRLMELAVSCPPHIGISLVALCHRIALRYPAIKGMFIGGADNELPGRGAYRPEAANLQNSNAEGRFAWEMTLLRHSYHPAVREVAQHVASHYQRVAKAVQGATAPIVSRTLDALQADALLERYDPSRGLIVPAPALPKGMAGQRRARSPSPSNEAE